MPLGAMIAREDMADAFWGSQEDGLQFAHGHTFAGNPLAVRGRDRRDRRNGGEGSAARRRCAWATYLADRLALPEEARRGARGARARACCWAWSSSRTPARWSHSPNWARR